MIEVKRNEVVNKTTSKMSEKEILRQQLELLAEKSSTTDDLTLCEMSNVMLNIAFYLSSKDESVL